MDREKYAEQTDQLHAAIGRWVVWFSQMIDAMDTSVAMKLIQSGSPQGWVHAALAGREAYAIQQSYFTLLGEVGKNVLGKEDRALVGKLRNEVIEQIEFRNRMLHDVLYVGWSSREQTDWSTGDKYRIAPTKEGVDYRSEELAVGPLLTRAERLEAVANLLRSILTHVALHPQRPQPAIYQIYEVVNGEVRRRPEEVINAVAAAFDAARQMTEG